MTTDANPTAETIHLSKRRFRLVVGALMLGLLLAALDQTIVSTALPTIVGDLHGGSHLAWVVTAYLLASTVSMPMWGKLGDMYGRKTFFQASIALFLLGSILSGLSGNMFELIAFRAVQGLGAGGLMIGAQSILGDIVSPRERGRYQGLFGGVFGLASIVGPLLGGVFVEDLSWRWIFYINVPVGAVALAVIAFCVPGHLSRVHHVIDYLGITVLSLAVTSVVLLTSLGGTTYSWNSLPIWILGICGVLLIGLFITIERKAVEPVLPLHLFSNKVFSVSSSVGFVMGFVMFGALVFLPLYMQDVRGASPTVSGLRLLPLMGGFLITSILSGQLISKTGRYKIWPVGGMAFAALAMGLMATLRSDTSFWELSFFMFLFGVGLGGVLQVLIIAVQNSVPHSELGTATSGVSFFRTIGGSFGTAVFGAIFSNVIVSRLAVNLATLHLGSGANKVVKNLTSQGLTPSGFDHLPPAVHAAVSTGFTQALDEVFLIAVPIAVIAFLLTWLLPEVKLSKQRPGAGSVESTDSQHEPELVSSVADFG